MHGIQIQEKVQDAMQDATNSSSKRGYDALMAHDASGEETTAAALV